MHMLVCCIYAVQYAQAQKDLANEEKNKKKKQKPRDGGWFSWMWWGGDSDDDDSDDVVMDETIQVPKPSEQYLGAAQHNLLSVAFVPVCHHDVMYLLTDTGHWLDDLTAEERNELFKGVGYVENINTKSSPDVSIDFAGC